MNGIEASNLIGSLWLNGVREFEFGTERLVIGMNKGMSTWIGRWEGDTAFLSDVTGAWLHRAEWALL